MADDGDKPALGTRDLFARHVRDYVYHVLGRPVAVLQAGCHVSPAELGLDGLWASGFELTVRTVDDDHPVTRSAARRAGGVVLADLRTVPLTPRSFDVVYCASVLERVAHAELVFDRLVAALRPGGLLLLRVHDRNSASAAVDRHLPEPVRRAVWGRLRPGETGPPPAVYNRLASARAIESYASSRGLVITRREATCTPRRGTESRLLCRLHRMACATIARLSRGAFTDAHDELRYVLRKPEDRSARVV